MKTAPASKHLVLVGGGHAHVTVIRALGMRPEPSLVTTLVAKEIEAPYSGMLPGYVAGHCTYDDVHIDLIRLASWAGVRVVQGAVSRIDRAARTVHIGGRAPLPYDLLSIDIGITPSVGEIAGADRHAIAVKPVSTFAGKWKELERAALAPGGPRRLAVVGSGAAGFELVLAMRHRLRSVAARSGLDAEAFSFVLVGAGKLLPTHSASARRYAARELDSQGVELVENARVVAIESGVLRLAAGDAINADACLLTTNAKPAEWPGLSGLPVDERGFIAVRPTLQVLDDDNVFAVGDCATVLEHRREKAGVFAVRQGPPLTDNLRRRARGEPAKPFLPQRHFLTLLSTGGERAIAARNGIAVTGSWAWKWKDRIDRAFMAKFNDLPAMSPARVGAVEEMRCAGCGAKVGPLTLAAALEQVTRSPQRLRDDAAVFDEGGETLRLETIDFFRAFWSEPYLFGEIAANHAMSDIFAMGGTPTHALANIVLPYAWPRRVEEDLVQVLAGATAAFAREGAEIAGGHTSEGGELCAGFYVAGRVRRHELRTRAGLRPGDALLVTRPLGTGILFASLMRGQARGRAIAAAIEEMRVSNRAAAEVLLRHEASAMTDVTGFGLAGHLIEMIDASRVAACLRLGSVPVYPSVWELAQAGIASSLLPENARLSHRLSLRSGSSEVTLAVLFDPQTAGGLLAGVPAPRLDACLDALKSAGARFVAHIGEVVELNSNGEPHIEIAG